MKLILLLIVLSLLVAALAFLFIISPGKVKPFIDKEGKVLAGSVSEKTFVKIGGVEQGMFIRGKDINNPVLLFVHGGPSFPEYFLVEKYPSGLEEYFTVCYWEQRGGGISYTPQVTIESMTLQHLESDAIEVTNYLRNRFGKEKIYIMAHSGGTVFTIQAVAEYPQLYHAYMAMAQITSQKDSEKIAYKYLLERYMDEGNRKMVAEFKKFPILEDDSLVLPFFSSVVRDKAMHERGVGTMHNMKSIIKDIFIPVWNCRAYSLKEKFNFWIAKFSFVSRSGLRSEVLNSDIPADVPRLSIPVYFFSGKYDMTVNIDLSKDYLTKLEAPVKGFYTFDESAHSPMFEEPQRLKDILITDVLNSTTTLADKDLNASP